MREILRSPFTIGVCLVALLAWILTLVAIFWPRRGDTKPDAGQEEDLHGYF